MQQLGYNRVPFLSMELNIKFPTYTVINLHWFGEKKNLFLKTTLGRLFLTKKKIVKVLRFSMKQKAI